MRANCVKTGSTTYECQCRPGFARAEGEGEDAPCKAVDLRIMVNHWLHGNKEKRWEHVARPALTCCESGCESRLGGAVGTGSQACQVGCRYAYHQQCEQSCTNQVLGTKGGQKWEVAMELLGGADALRKMLNKLRGVHVAALEDFVNQQAAAAESESESESGAQRTRSSSGSSRRLMEQLAAAVVDPAVRGATHVRLRGAGLAPHWVMPSASVIAPTHHSPPSLTADQGYPGEPKDTMMHAFCASGCAQFADCLTAPDAGASDVGSAGLAGHDAAAAVPIVTLAPSALQQARGQGGAWDWCDVGCEVVRGKLKVQHNRMGIVPGHYPQHYTDFKCELDVHDKRELLPASPYFVSLLQ